MNWFQGNKTTPPCAVLNWFQCKRESHKFCCTFEVLRQGLVFSKKFSQKIVTDLALFLRPADSATAPRNRMTVRKHLTINYLQSRFFEKMRSTLYAGSRACYYLRGFLD